MDAEISRRVDAMLTVLCDDVAPLSEEGVAAGSKAFGAAIIDRSALQLVAAGTNDEVRSPLLHGEVACLNAYWELPASTRPAPGDCFFITTHEPCSLCLSAITWSGFDNFYYLFSYEDTRDAFSIPHDLNILDEVFGCADGAYRNPNAYWTSHYLIDLVAQAEGEQRERWDERVARLTAVYGTLSNTYQASKGSAHIPLD